MSGAGQKLLDHVAQQRPNLDGRATVRGSEFLCSCKLGPPAIVFLLVVEPT